MSGDRELLELAAKAAGLRVVDKSHPVSLYVENGSSFGGVRWNPLTDDGDALRLAVKLGLHIEQYRTIRAYKLVPGGFWINGCEPIGDDPCAATRRAIVLAAAEIGVAM